MNSDLERGGLRRKMAELANPKNMRPSDAVLIAGILGLAVWGGVEHRRNTNANQFVPTKGAHIELAPVASTPRLVFESQMLTKCPGDGEVGNVQRLEIRRDGNGNFRELNVICQPNAAEPAK